MKRNKIILADDHMFLLEGIMTVLKEEPSLEIVATAKNGFELMDAVRKHLPELVVLDMNMPGLSGLQCLQDLKTNFSSIKVLVLTNYNEQKLIDKVKEMHAEGYMIKNSTSEELKEAVIKILAGEKYFPQTNGSKPVAEDSYFFDSFLKKHSLTKREVEIIRMVCKGMHTKQIAEALFLSELTINTHRRNILRKLEIKNVAGLINFAAENKLV